MPAPEKEIVTKLFVCELVTVGTHARDLSRASIMPLLEESSNLASFSNHKTSEETTVETIDPSLGHFD